MSMQMDLIKRENEAELKMNGYIDATNANEVETILVDLATKFDSLVLDMEKLEYVSSAGLRAFKHMYVEIRRRGGSLSAKNVDKSVMEVLEVTGFTRLFKFV
ncbi:MAG: STAS domain-containing protein [Clostridia bacterium]|nr:STAS domain-containing protein [Clostridia bacterium]